MTDLVHDRPAAVMREQPTPMELMSQAIAAGVTTGDLERLAALQERHEQRQAERAFGEALARFQSLCPIIKRSKTADTGKFKYNYASYDDIHFEIRALLADCGLTVSFDTEATDSAVTVICKVQHGTHVRPTRFTLPVPQMSVNNTQQFASALSYGKRYTLCAALNIVTSNDDDDGAALIEPINTAELAELEDALRASGKDVTRFLQWAKVSRLEDLAKAKFVEAMDMLTRKSGRGAK